MPIIATSRPIIVPAKCPIRAISARTPALFSLIQSQISTLCFYFPFNKLSPLSITRIPGHAIPVAEDTNGNNSPSSPNPNNIG